MNDQPIKLAFPPELPITVHVDEIRDHLESAQVVVVAGETGSGKTTQLPKICLAAGLGRKGMIGHTQPRRLAARTVAARIAEECAVPLGAEVGYAVRFSEMVSDRTRIKLITDGLLLTEIRRDKRLSRYDCLIVDEAHERSLNIDFLLGYLKTVLARRRELKLIITSATIDVAAFSEHFWDAPVVEVGGRTHPVTVRYLEEDPVAESSEDLLRATLLDIETGPKSRARDILMFLPGEREILETARFLRGEQQPPGATGQLEILPLYARLSATDQQRVFRPGKRRRIVLATNVAETSLTVPNIGYVIDPGLARISRYSTRSRIQRLAVEAISRASANQRAGRCGRVAPGICFRLYTEADFDGRPEFTDPEIKRTNLASVVLQMRAFDLGDPVRFPFMEPPDPRLIRDAEKVLAELGALEGDHLTRTGEVMARLPIDPRLARMLVAANETRGLAEVLIITSALAVSDPRERPIEKQGSADRAHEKWLDPRSDFVTLLNIWTWYEGERDRLSRSAARRTLEKNFLSNNRMREWRALHRQLLLAVKDLGFRVNAEPADYASIHRALLSGSLSLIGTHDEKGEYLGPRNLKFRIFPGSALAERRPKWVVAGELVETRRVYARAVAQVEPRWIEEAAPHLVKRTRTGPHWSLNRGEAMALESVSLYGLPLADGRRVSLKRFDPEAARALFLLEGLVHGAAKRPPPFLQHNLEVAAAIRADEERGRRRDLLATDADIAALYAARIPDGIASMRELDRWLRKAADDDVEPLFFSRADLTATDGVRISDEDFPPELVLGGQALPLKYTFAPGEPDDGISVQVPLGLIGVVVPAALDWSVPGMLAGVCEQWLRSLPKQKRRVIAPIPDTVAAVLPILLKEPVYRQGRFDVALARVVEQESGLAIRAEDWHRERIDPHWLINVQVLDADGNLLAQDRDAAVLQARFVAEVEQVLRDGSDQGGEAAGLMDFPDEPLADTVTLGEGGAQVAAYPALVDEGDTVAVRHFTSKPEQARMNRNGYARLALLKLGPTARYLKKQIAADKDLGLLFAPLGGAELFRDELLRACAWVCFFADRELPRDAETFMERIRAHRGELAETLMRLQSQLRAILEVRHALARELDGATSPAFADAVADIRAQLAALVPPDVLTITPSERLSDIPRYLEAARHRLANLQGKISRDAEQTAVVGALKARLERLEEQMGRESPAWQALHYLLEEVRVGLFAERIGVRDKASVKRLDRRLETLERDHGLI
jgi:ATP-dependent helicase HrpA